MMTNDTNPFESPTSELTPPIDGVRPRQDLVPLWIKIFAWIFIAAAVLTLPALLYGVFAETNVYFDLFGFSYNGPALNPYAFALVALYLFMGVTAYGLLFRKDWGVLGCLANGYLGVAMCVIGMFLAEGLNIRLELFIHFFYLRHLHSIRQEWDEAGQQHAD